MLAFAAIIQLTVYIAQAVYMHRGLALTRQAAWAAEKSAEAAIKTVEEMQLQQRAWIGLVLQDGGTRSESEAGLHPWDEEYWPNPGTIEKTVLSTQLVPTPIIENHGFSRH